MNIINSKNKDNSLNYREEENIILTIRMILLLIGFSLVFSIIDIGFMLFGIADDYSGLFIDGSFLIFYLISYFLCKKGKNRYGRVLFVIVGNFHAGLTALYFGKGSGAEWHILEFFLIPMLLFSRKDKWFIFSSMILSFSIWMVVQYYNKYLPSIHKWSPEKLGILYTMNTIFVYIIVAACMFYFFKAIHNAENNLYKEKLVSESLLLNILPKRISDRLKQNQELIADEFKEASVLFADIVGFTGFSQKVSASELVHHLNSLFSRFDELTEEFQVEKIKTIGDAYMIVSGVPEVSNNHAEKLINMALEMLKEIKIWNETYKLDLNLRIGIHSGPLVAGVIGKKKFTYDLWGDTVNTASRMESHGVPGKIHVSSSTYELVNNTFSFLDRGEIEIKGKGKMKTFLVEAVRVFR